MSPIDAAALESFRETFAGEVVRPGDASYDATRVVWNGMIDRRPAILVRPTGDADVRSAVRFAREQDLIVAVRSGGHSVPGYSTCDDGIVIDLSRMRGARVDPGRRIAEVNGGALLGELDSEAQTFGLACPVGVVAHTGVAGLTLGGGMGRLHRKFGLTIDNLLSVDMVTADGRLVHASEDENADLFWGMRGAGANFGIVTSFALRLHAVGPTITSGSVLHPIDRARDAAAVYREFVDSSSDEIMPSFAIGRAVPEDEFPPEVAGRPIVVVGALDCGPPESAQERLAALRRFGSPVLDTFGPRSYLAVQRQDDDVLAWGRRFSMKSAFLSSLPDTLIDSWIGHVADAPGDDCSYGVWSWGRCIANVAEDATAFTGRTAAFWAGAEAFWDDPAQDDAHRAWSQAAMATAAPYAVTGRYVNDVAESGVDVVRAIYGDAKYERLVALKRAWDPDNVFRLNQNIVP